MDREYQVREKSSNRVVKRLSSEREVVEFLSDQSRKRYYVWEVERLSGRLRAIYEGTNLDALIIKYDEPEID